MNDGKVRVRPKGRNAGSAVFTPADLAAVEAAERRAWVTLTAVIYSDPVFRVAWEAHAEAADRAAAAQATFDASRKKGRAPRRRRSRRTGA